MHFVSRVMGEVLSLNKVYLYLKVLLPDYLLTIANHSD